MRVVAAHQRNLAAPFRPLTVIRLHNVPFVDGLNQPPPLHILVIMDGGQLTNEFETTSPVIAYPLVRWCHRSHPYAV